ncbi:MAG TPA: hypothetical protein VIK67_05450 [Acholeplasma sp.]
MEQQASFYDFFDIILINPEDEITSYVDNLQDNIIYKITYEEVDGQYIQIIQTTIKGIEIGLPVYDGELVFIQINSTKTFETNVLYSNLYTINNLDYEELIFPINPFIKKSYDPIVSFKIVSELDEGNIYLLKDNINIETYLQSKNRWNYINNVSFTGSSTYLKSDYISKYDIFMILYTMITLLPVIFCLIVFNFLLRYQFDKRFDEIIIRNIFFASNKNIFNQFILEFLVMTAPITILGIIVSYLIIPVNIFYIPLFFVILIVIYMTFFTFSINARLKRVIREKRLEILLRSSE